MNNRSYNQFCALASALDVVGDRWTLLIIRELLTGPRRFKDLLDGLPEISTNLLAERLKGLERRGILCRRILPPPAGSTVYELLPVGWALKDAVLELGRWGSQFLPASLEGVSLPSVGAMALAIQAFFHPEMAEGIDETYELHIGKEILHVQIREEELQVQTGPARKPDVVIHTEMPCFVALFAGQLEPEQADHEGIVRVEGDPGGLDRFMKLCGVPRSR
jgi:DNA-binding HxlR family transcriptional regulator